MILKNFKQYHPKHALFGDDVVYLIDDAGNDWYNAQKAFPAETLKVVFDKTGKIISCSKDVSALFPLDCSVLDVLSDDDLDLVGHFVIDDQVIFSKKPSDSHEWNGTGWEISPAKMTALLITRKAALLTLIANKTDDFKAQYLVGYSQAEIDSFYRQEREARGELPLMLLTEIFEGRDDLTDIDALKQKVIDKADLFAIIMGKLFAIKQNFEKHIEQAETLEQLAEIEQEINQWQKL